MEAEAGDLGGIYGLCLPMQRSGEKKQSLLIWFWWGMWRAIRSARTSPAKGGIQRLCKHSDEWNNWSGFRELQIGQGTQSLLHLGLNGMTDLKESQLSQTSVKFQSKKDLPSVEEGWLRNYINKWTYTWMPGTDGILTHGKLRSASSQFQGRSSSESSCTPFLKAWRGIGEGIYKEETTLQQPDVMRELAGWLRGDQWLLFIFL